MAYRRVLLIGDKISETKTELENMFSSKLFKTNYSGVKTKIIVSPVKNDTLVVDLNGEGADTVSKKVKDIGQKNKMKATIKTEKPMSKVGESKITKSTLKKIVKEEIKKVLKEDAYDHTAPNVKDHPVVLPTKYIAKLENKKTGMDAYIMSDPPIVYFMEIQRKTKLQFGGGKSDSFKKIVLHLKKGGYDLTPLYDKGIIRNK